MDDYLQRIDTAYENLRKQMEGCDDPFLLNVFGELGKMVNEVHEFFEDETAFFESPTTLQDDTEIEW